MQPPPLPPPLPKTRSSNRPLIITLSIIFGFIALIGVLAAIVAFVLSVRRGETPSQPKVSVPVEVQFDADGRASA